ncbi:hypothetical protein ASPCAL05246 [Aspergillus calidoustus]|uniref:Zn(2)-C6 fungal-type domain-containing protein n=1 Tax=Aspergillus calidoustus TaxID=454130 RepID=A0A0U5FWU1_ASPCI|nr:hypothetical protein ASPCAL05246 [Aspergillus calidoustus]
MGALNCDEKRPICSNCISSERLCGYAELTFLAMQPGGAGRKRARSQESPSSSSPPELPSLAQPDPPVNMLHAELFYHLSTKTLPSLSENDSSLTILPEETINYGLAAPYLMNELLALAALHLSIIRTPQKEFYRYHSAQLQNHTLRLFHETKLAHSGQVSVPAFCFSSILGLHLLCDTLAFRDDDFQDFLDRFIHYLRIHRGVRTIIKGNWGFLKQTSLGGVLTEGEARLDNELGHEEVCGRLLGLIKKAKLGPVTTRIYEQAIEALQRSMNASKDDTAGGGRHGATAWPVMVSVEYTDMLVERRPEALVILAHYAVLLYRCRDMWIFDDGGRFLIGSVARYLGAEWREWMEWPQSVLVGSADQCQAAGS